MNKNETLKRRDREKIARRNDILKAALSVFAKKTYESATLDEIAEKAEYGKGTLYNYFKSKEDIFINLMLHGTNQFEKTVIKAVKHGKNCREKMKNIVRESLKFSAQNSDFYRVLLKEYGRFALAAKGNFKKNMLKSHSSLIRVIADVIEQGIKKSEIRKMDSQKVAAYFVNMIHKLIWETKCFNSKIVSDKEVDFMISLFFDGVAVKKNQK